MSENIEIEITGREAKLILKYGYPFPDQKPLFEAIAGKQGFHLVNIDQYWLEHIIGDLARSIKETRSEALQEELDALCDSLELAISRIN
jgi:hypothetical protein